MIRNSNRLILRSTIVAPGLLMFMLFGCTPTSREPTFSLREAPRIQLPGVIKPEQTDFGPTDCNNPVHWSAGRMFVFSSMGHPWRSSGSDLLNLERRSERTVFDNAAVWKGGARWIESTHKDEDGLLYGWYHNEPSNVCPGTGLTAPRIGAVVSEDDGLHWRDLGIVLEAPAGSLNCGTPNVYFAGGNGDFVVIQDQARRFFYFLFSTYHQDPAEQGVAVARMRCSDRKDPVGKVWKWRAGDWREPGLGGHVTPIFTVAVDWHRQDVDALWGPSVHWNTHLRQYVMLLNRAVDPAWKQEGVYISFNPDLAVPTAWSKPTKVLGDLGGDEWYPQVIGTDKAKGETDKLAGRAPRLFVRGVSRHEIVFDR